MNRRMFFTAAAALPLAVPEIAKPAEAKPAYAVVFPLGHIKLFKLENGKQTFSVIHASGAASTEYMAYWTVTDAIGQAFKHGFVVPSRNVPWDYHNVEPYSTAKAEFVQWLLKYKAQM